MAEQTEMQNQIHLRDFIDKWKGRDGFESDVTSGQMMFPAVVEYTCGGTKLKHHTRVVIYRFGGIDDGKISLEENHRLNKDDWHLDFNPRSQDYYFQTSTKRLRIVGDSDKMGGNYTVEITP